MAYSNALALLGLAMILGGLALVWIAWDILWAVQVVVGFVVYLSAVWLEGKALEGPAE